MQDLYSPTDNVELAFLKGILDAEGINYFVRNEQFGSLLVGPDIGLYNRRTIVVDDADIERARELLEDYLARTAEAPAGEELRQNSSWDKVRMIAETLLFGWMMPGRRK